MRVDDDMERLAAEDYLAMVAEARASGAKIVFITYPVEKGAFAVANHAMRRVAKATGSEDTLRFAEMATGMSVLLRTA